MREWTYMRCKCKKSLSIRTADILRSNEGASIVLVTIISILVVASVIILSINVNTLISSADKQYFRDQAYESARTMGSSIDDLINENKLNLEDHADGTELISDSSNNIEVTVTVSEVTTSANTYTVSITAKAGSEEYVYTATYYGSNNVYMRVN